MSEATDSKLPLEEAHDEANAIKEKADNITRVAGRTGEPTTATYDVADMSQAIKKRKQSEAKVYNP